MECTNQTAIVSGSCLALNFINPQAKNWYEIGRLYAGSFRRLCIILNLVYEEERGFLDSFFIVKGSYHKIEQLNQQVALWNTE